MALKTAFVSSGKELVHLGELGCSSNFHSQQTFIYNEIFTLGNSIHSVYYVRVDQKAKSEGQTEI